MISYVLVYLLTFFLLCLSHVFSPSSFIVFTPSEWHDPECDAHRRADVMITKMNKVESAENIAPEDDALIHFLVMLFFRVQDFKMRSESERSVKAGDVSTHCTDSDERAFVRGGKLSRENSNFVVAPGEEVCDRQQGVNERMRRDQGVRDKLEVLEPAATACTALAQLYAVTTNRAFFSHDHINSMVRIAQLLQRLLPGADVEETVGE